MDDAYTVQVTAAESQDADGLEQLMALKDADTFVVADIWGDMKGGAARCGSRPPAPSARPSGATACWSSGR